MEENKNKGRGFPLSTTRHGLASSCGVVFLLRNRNPCQVSEV
jgi:hypothetical protein